MFEPKYLHEFRDPVHGFIRVHTDERAVIDSPPVQRLRHIQQLALTSLIYPGACHTRFEHSLGVMHVADQIFQVLTQQGNLSKEVKARVPQIADEKNRERWLKHLRMAALLHDVGHYPFSHAAEESSGLLPRGWTHEVMSFQIICAEPLRGLLSGLGLAPESVGRIAVGRKCMAEVAEALRLDTTTCSLSDWEFVLSQIITGDFGADRIDYLLRDSLHTGVAYGKFDQLRLIDCLRVLLPPVGQSKIPRAPHVGAVQGGLQAVEGLLVARHFMFVQVYYHPVRQAYDRLIQEFLQDFLKGKQLPTTVPAHLRLSDVEVWSSLRTSKAPSAVGIRNREHFKKFGEVRPPTGTADRASQLELLAKQKFGSQSVFLRLNPSKSLGLFPVELRDNSEVVLSEGLSTLLDSPPLSGIHYLFIEPTKIEEARQWCASELKN